MSNGNGLPLLSQAFRSGMGMLAWFVIGLSLWGVVANATPPEGMRKPRHGGVYVVAHRGAHQGIPENTLAAYRTAIELGCDYVEIDVRTTRDGVLVSVHDATIDRYVTTGKTGRVDGMTLQELKELDIGSRVGPQFAEERIPTLEEIFALCRGKIGIYLDMKAADLAQVYRLVHDFEMEKEMLWYIPSKQVAELRSLSLELLPMPDPGPIDRLDALLKETQPPVVAAVWRHFSQEFVERCHASDAIVIVDEGGKESWPSALAWGVDGIQTDHPKELIDFLDKQP